MAKYRLLRDASNYSYKTVSAPELIGGNGTKQVKDKLLYTIPKGTIIEAEPSKFNGGDNEDFPNSFQVSIKKDSDKYTIFLSNIRDVKNNTYFIKDLELVSKDSKVTLDKNLKVINPAEKQTVQPLSVTDPELFKKNMELSAKKDAKMKQLKYGVIAVVLIAGYFAYKKFKK